jgi:hypothetical protein
MRAGSEEGIDVLQAGPNGNLKRAEGRTDV